MLVLSRKKDEQIMIGDSIVITVTDVGNDKIRLGIEAPRDVAIHRREVYDAIKARETHVEIAAPTPHELPLEGDGGPAGEPILAETVFVDRSPVAPWHPRDLGVLGITPKKPR